MVDDLSTLLYSNKFSTHTTWPEWCKPARVSAMCKFYDTAENFICKSNVLRKTAEHELQPQDRHCGCPMQSAGQCQVRAEKTDGPQVSVVTAETV